MLLKWVLRRKLHSNLYFKWCGHFVGFKSHETSTLFKIKIRIELAPQSKRRQQHELFWKHRRLPIISYLLVFLKTNVLHCLKTFSELAGCLSSPCSRCCYFLALFLKEHKWARSFIQRFTILCVYCVSYNLGALLKFGLVIIDLLKSIVSREQDLEVWLSINVFHKDIFIFL